MRLSLNEFESVVAQVMDGLPDRLRHRIANVHIAVADAPSAEQRRSMGLARGEALMGLYEGVPLTERGSAYGMVEPDRITVFRRPILDACTDLEEVREEIRRTVLHELAHYFGIDDDRLEAIGAY